MLKMVNLKIKIFEVKTLKRKVFISDNIKRGFAVYISGDLGIWNMAEKNTPSVGPKIEPCNIGRQPPDDPLIQNLIENLFSLLPVQL